MTGSFVGLGDGSVSAVKRGISVVFVEKLDAYQRLPYGTPAHKKSHRRRNHSENKISMLSDRGNFALGWCRVFNRMAFTLGTLAKS